MADKTSLSIGTSDAMNDDLGFIPRKIRSLGGWPLVPHGTREPAGATS